MSSVNSDRLPSLTVPTNWDPALVEILDPSRVGVVYGKLPKDLIGGGRVAAFLPSVSRRAARQHIRAVRDRGLDFNYLLNATCFGNREWTRAWRRSFDRLLSWIVDAGASSVTVSTGFLCEVVRRQAPHLKVMVSTMAGVASPERALEWQALGAAGVTLSVADGHRDFARLRRIREAVPGMHLALIGNLACFPGCPHWPYQANITSHASQSEHGSRGLAIDYCLLSCALRRAEDPLRFLRGSWIRPEDQHHYAALGIDAIKLVDRSMPTPVLHRVIGAYAAARYDGNLFDLLSLPSQNAEYGDRDLWRAFQYFFRPTDINVFRLYGHRDAFAYRPMRLDNRALDGFLDFFVEGHCRYPLCGSCRHCDEAVEAAFSFEEGERQGARKALDALKSDLVSGRLSRYLRRPRRR